MFGSEDDRRGRAWRWIWLAPVVVAVAVAAAAPVEEQRSAALGEGERGGRSSWSMMMIPGRWMDGGTASTALRLYQPALQERDIARERGKIAELKRVLHMR